MAVDNASVRVVLLTLLAIGCAGEPYAPPEYRPMARDGQTWSYCGAYEYTQLVRDTVAWWGVQGRSMGRQVPCDFPSNVEISDLTGQDLNINGEEYFATAEYERDWAIIRLYRGFFRQASDGHRRTTLRHEFGHIFGFGHTYSPACVMSGVDTGIEDQELCTAEREALGGLQTR